MARTFRRNSVEYQPGIHGPFSLDSFTRNDTDRIVITLTRENWPQQDNIANLSIRWDTGEGCSYSISGIPATLPNGTLQTTFTASCNVPKIRDGNDHTKRPVVRGEATIEVFQTLRTAISVEAVSTS